jgi:hypothetical protein
LRSWPVHFCQPDIAQHDHAASRAIEIEADTSQMGQVKMRIRAREVVKRILVATQDNLRWHLGIYRYSDVMAMGRRENGPYHSLGDWARPHDMYSNGGMVEGNGRYHARASDCAIHQSAQ